MEKLKTLEEIEEINKLIQYYQLKSMAYHELMNQPLPLRVYNFAISDELADKIKESARDTLRASIKALKDVGVDVGFEEL